MSHSYCANHIHVVFSTKDRKPTIVEKERMWGYVGGVGKRIGVQTIAIGGMKDHLHILLALPADLTLAHVINAMKVNSSRWAKARVPSFTWQRGYAAFSVSASNIAAVKLYIEHQERHHAKRDFEAEFIELLERHGVKYDRIYVFG